MSKHWIDDIFKKGLSKPDYIASDADWQGAREMLGLAKRRRRTPLWLWFGGVAAALFITVAVAKTWGTLKADPTVSQELVNDVQDDKVNQDVVTSSVVASSTEDTFNTETKEEIQSASFAQNSNEQSNRSVTEDNIINQTDRIATIASNESLKTSSDRTENIAFIKSTSVSPAVKPIIDVDKSGSEVNSSSSSSITDAVANTNELDAAIIAKAVGLENNRFELSPIALLSLEELPYSFVDLKQYVGPLLASASLYNKLVVVAPTVRTREASHFGLYTSLDFVDVTPALGVYGGVSFSKNLFMNIGVGFHFQSDVSVLREGTIEALDLNGQAQAVDAEESIISDLYNVEMPIHLGYRMGRHSLFGGVLFDYPIYTTTAIMSDLTPSFSMDMTVDPATPVMAPTNNGVTIDQTISNARDLQKISTQLRLGYAYRISRRWSLEAIGGYRLTSSQENSTTVSRQPLFNQGQGADIPVDVQHYNGSIVLRYRF